MTWILEGNHIDLIQGGNEGRRWGDEIEEDYECKVVYKYMKKVVLLC